MILEKNYELIPSVQSMLTSKRNKLDKMKLNIIVDMSLPYLERFNKQNFKLKDQKREIIDMLQGKKNIENQFMSKLE